MSLDKILQSRLGELLLVVAKQEAHIAALETERDILSERLAAIESPPVQENDDGAA